MIETMTAVRTLDLLSNGGDNLGKVRIEEIDHGQIGGAFEPAEGFALLEPIFRRYTEIVEQQSFTYLDQIESEIARLGLKIQFDDGTAPQRVYHVQIYTDGEYGFSCRLLNP